MAYRVLSSAQTFQVKYLGPLLLLALTLFLIGMLELGLFPDLYRQMFHGGLSPAFIDAFWGGWILLILGSCWWSYRLKWVAVDGDSIYISDYVREVKLPLASIIEVRENRWLKSHLVSIQLGAETPWGSTIRFMPKIRLLTPNWVSHPVVEELRDMAYWARADKRIAAELAGASDAGFVKPGPDRGLKP